MRLQERRDLMHIGRSDVSRVSARMHRDTWSASIDTDPHGIDHRRNAAATRISNRRDLVDVYRQLDHVMQNAKFKMQTEPAYPILFAFCILNLELQLIPWLRRGP
jgi:hypothetical protein